MSIRSIAIAMVILIASASHAQEKGEIEFKTPKPRQAQIVFKAKLLRLEREYQLSVTKARQEYRIKMEKLKKEITQAGNLEEAIRIRDAIANVKAVKPLAPKLRSRPKLGPVRIPKGAMVWGGHHYLVVESKDSWHEAQAKCRAAGGHLVSIGSVAEQKLMKRLAPNIGMRYWAGGTDEGTEGRWRWTDGTSWKAVGFAPGQPDGQFGYGDYILFEGGVGIWNDFHASGLWGKDQFVHGYICEWNR